MGLEDESLARFWVSSLRACKEVERGEGHRRNASFHAEQACQCKISSSLRLKIIFAYFYLQAAYQPVFFINDCWNFTCVIFPQHIVYPRDDMNEQHLVCLIIQPELALQREGWYVRDGHHLLLSPSSIFRPITSDGQPPLPLAFLLAKVEV